MVQAASRVAADVEQLGSSAHQRNGRQARTGLDQTGALAK
jgi:hypothetical protein